MSNGIERRSHAPCSMGRIIYQRRAHLVEIGKKNPGARGAASFWQPFRTLDAAWERAGLP